MNDFDTATELASKFDDQVKTDAGKYGDDYVGIVELSMRQAFGGMELSIPATGSTDGAMYWLKEISSDGVRCVKLTHVRPDGLTSSRRTCKPSMSSSPPGPSSSTATSTSARCFSSRCLRTSSPASTPTSGPFTTWVATTPRVSRDRRISRAHSVLNTVAGLGHNDGKDEAMQVEESGNMILMEYSYVMKTGDTTQASKYYDLLAQWTGKCFEVLCDDSELNGFIPQTSSFPTVSSPATSWCGP